VVRNWRDLKRHEWDRLAPVCGSIWPRTEDFEFYLDLARKEGSPILEIGCGTGRVGCHLAANGFDVAGIDISSGQIREAERLRSEPPDATRNHVEFLVEDATKFSPRFKRRRSCFSMAFAPFSTIFEFGDS